MGSISNTNYEKARKIHSLNGGNYEKNAKNSFTKWGFTIFAKLTKIHYFDGFYVVRFPSTQNFSLNGGFSLFCRSLNRGFTVFLKDNGS